MKYERMMEGRFLSRPNRFIAHMEIQGEQVTAHVKNAGHYRELLIPGVTVFLQHYPSALEAGWETEYSLIGVYKGDVLINIGSQAPNQVAGERLYTGDFTREAGIAVSDVHQEMICGNSRFDLAFLADGEQAYMEVKGVTLETDHVVKLPDVPTERGIKHVKELALASKRRFRVYILLIIQMKGIASFMPDMDTHPVFGEVLQGVSRAGIHIMVYDCIVTKEGLSID